jgi:uncharacterized protein
MSENFKFFEWKNSGKLLRGSLNISSESRAPWFIFCHGFTGQRMGPGYLFVKIARSLSEAGFSSLRFDFSGAGESDGIFSEMNISTMESDLLCIIKKCRSAFDPSSLVLLGHSFGGMVSAQVAGSIEADGLVLLSPVADPTGLTRRRQSLLESGPNERGLYENGPHEMDISFLNMLKDVDPVGKMASDFRGPLLLIQGDNDPSIAVKESGRYVDMAGKAGIKTEYVIVPGADHNYSRVSDVNLLLSKIVNWAKERFL